MLDLLKAPGLCTFFLKLMPENQDHSGRLTVYVQIPLPQDVFTNQIWDS